MKKKTDWELVAFQALCVLFAVWYLIVGIVMIINHY